MLPTRCYLPLLLAAGLYTGCTGKKAEQFVEPETGVTRGSLFQFSSGQHRTDSLGNLFEHRVSKARANNNRAVEDSLLRQYLDSLYRWSEKDTTFTYYPRLQSLAGDIISKRGSMLNNPADDVLARSYMERCFDLYDNSQYGHAYNFINQYLCSWAAEKTPWLTDTWNLKARLGDIYIRLGDNRKGMELLMGAFHFFKQKQTPDDKVRAANNCVSIANNFNQMGQFPKAVPYIDSGLMLVKGVLEKKPSKVSALARLLAVKAEYYLFANIPGIAETYVEQAIAKIAAVDIYGKDKLYAVLYAILGEAGLMQKKIFIGITILPAGH